MLEKAEKHQNDFLYNIGIKLLCIKTIIVINIEISVNSIDRKSKGQYNRAIKFKEAIHIRKLVIIVLGMILLSASAFLVGCSNNSKSNTDNTAGDTVNTTDTGNTTNASDTSVTSTPAAGTTANADTGNSVTSAPADTSSTDTQTVTFTLDELKKYDGQNGNPAYVAVDGVVYDVTNANRWKDGKHQDGVTAGADLTDVISQSPHGKDVLKDLPVVGTLVG